MKRILLVMVILLAVGAVVFAQSGSTPSSAEVRQTAQQYLNQARSDATEFDSVLDTLRSRNMGNRDLVTFNAIRTEMDRIAHMIETEESAINASLDRGNTVNPEMLERIERMIEQYRDKQAELEAFLAN